MNQSYLLSLFKVDFETGEMYWKEARGRHDIVKQAGTIEVSGYRVIKIDGCIYKQHRLIWLAFFGQWPIAELDHIDNNKANNSITNLRLLTRSQNMLNSPVRKDSKTEVKGVTLHKESGKYRADIRVNYKLKYLGLFSTIEEARLAYEREANNVRTYS